MDWLSKFISKGLDVFGELNQCLLYDSEVQGPSRLSMSRAKPGTSQTLGLWLPTLPYRMLDSDDRVLLSPTQTQPNICILTFTNNIIQTFDISASFLTISATIPISRDGEERDNLNRVYAAFSIAMTTNPETSRMCVLILGLHVASALTAIPAAAMELQAQQFNNINNGVQEQIGSIEITTRMGQFHYPFETRNTSSRDWKRLDSILTTRDLSSLLSRLAFLELQAETRASLVYCLIASRDNLTNIDIARASRSIAEGTRRENEATRTLAEFLSILVTTCLALPGLVIQVANNSKTIAVTTARDSASMQVTATVTILFVPATFTTASHSRKFKWYMQN
ncbi:hypothetical protein F4860DRAFT_507727 [Xylaria cubensis]|nr:hypothetical protein F4860DRAFT_507727 [Xylaria cubensis]